jgi:nitrate reductase gamma subunit
LDWFSFLVGNVLSYVAIVVFFVGVPLQIYRWMRAPVVYPLTDFPAPKTAEGAFIKVLLDTFLFRPILLKIYDATVYTGKWTDLWLGGWIFHVSLALIIIGHIVGIGTLGHQFTILGVSPETSLHMSEFLGTVSGIFLSLSLIYLFLRRFFNPLVRVMSDGIDYLIVLLILGISCMGNFMRFSSTYGVEYDVAQRWIIGLFTLHPVALPDNPIFTWHLFLVEILLIYFPFSKLMHSCGIFFARWMITNYDPKKVMVFDWRSKVCEWKGGK